MKKCLNCGWQGETTKNCPTCGDSRLEELIGDSSVKEPSLDLNGDGKVDGKDATIAGKVLAHQKKKRNKK